MNQGRRSHRDGDRHKTLFKLVFCNTSMAKGSPVLALTLIVLGLGVNIGTSNLKPPFSQMSDGPRGPAEPYGTVTATVTPRRRGCR